jgi:hypothetical protein
MSMKVILCSLASIIAIIIIAIGSKQAPFPESAAARRSNPENEMGQARRRSEELDAWIADNRRRDAAKQEIVKAVAARRFTLVEAAFRYRDLHRTEPESQQRLFHQYAPGASAGERFCRSVLRDAENGLPKGDSRDALVASLKRELRGLLENGTLRLRDWAPPPGRPKRLQGGSAGMAVLHHFLNLFEYR